MVIATSKEIKVNVTIQWQQTYWCGFSSLDTVKRAEKFSTTNRSVLVLVSFWIPGRKLRNDKYGKRTGCNDDHRNHVVSLVSTTSHEMIMVIAAAIKNPNIHFMYKFGVIWMKIRIWDDQETTSCFSKDDEGSRRLLV